MAASSGRGTRLDNAPLDYAPENELGVVYLFSAIAKKKLGLRVESIRGHFPDCVAYRGTKRVRIEFEYRSRNFRSHRHSARECDWLVCWVHDWPSTPPRLRVVELRRYFGKGFNVWVVPVTGQYREKIGRVTSNQVWSAPSQASQDDLVLFHRTKPFGYIGDIFKFSGPIAYQYARWKQANDWMAPIKRVATLRAPIHLQQLRTHSILSTAGFVRSGIRTRFRVTAHWPELHALIIDANPSSAKALAKYSPERLA
jgi:hypothetical protein